MKDASFSLTIVLLSVLGVALIAGGVFAANLNAKGIGGVVGLCLAAFLPVPLGASVRQAVSRAAVDVAGVDGPSPFAFSLSVRLAVGAAVAAVIAFAFSLNTSFSFGVLLGAVAALLTSVILTLIFYLKTSVSR